MAFPASVAIRDIDEQRDVRYPPRPIDMAPAHNSARPPVTTRLLEPSDERPAVRAKGTVRPSDRPMMLFHERLIPLEHITLSMRLYVVLPKQSHIKGRNATYTSRTISGEIKCLSSSPFKSLQH
jgi:hypothetical protein